MPILPMLLVVAACLAVPWPAPPAGLGVADAALLTLGLSAVPVLAAVTLSHWVAVTLAADPGRRPEVLRRYVRGRRCLGYSMLLLLAGVLGGGWGWAVWHGPLVLTAGDREVLFPGAEGLAPLPYVLMLLGCWAAYHRAELALHRTAPPEWAARRFWTLPGYVLFHARQMALFVLLPVAGVSAQQGLARAFPETVRSPGFQAAAVAGGVLLFVFLPRLAVPLLGLKPLPAGPARDRLAATARRLDVRLTDLLVWPTRGASANALVMGVTPWARYVVLTDRLLEHLPADELEVVFGHEAGHVTRGHSGHYAAFMALSVAAWAVLAVAVERAALGWGWLASPGTAPGWLVGPAVLLVCGYVFVVFGFVSRRCERQADVAGARAGSCGDPWCRGHTAETPRPAGEPSVCRAGALSLIGALERVGSLNGGEAAPPAGRAARALARVRAWQHGPVADRCDFLRKLADDPTLADRTDADAARARLLVLAALVVVTLAAGTAAGWGAVWARL